MTVNYGLGMDLYVTKKAKLGQDPLREDADPELLWTKVKKSKTSIGAVIMDQSYFTGPGNIYRAEILFKAGVHPDIPGMALQRSNFDQIWQHTVTLLQRGYQTGSILTVDPEEARRLGKPKLRRYIYNTSHCPRCKSRIQVWDIAGRTCYACPTCQPKQTAIEDSKKPRGKRSTNKDCEPFNSHCARESVETRLDESGPERLTVKEIKTQLHHMGVRDVPTGRRKAALVKLLVEHRKAIKEHPSLKIITPAAMPTTSANAVIVSSEAAAAEKACSRLDRYIDSLQAYS
ncbi:expressed unknown protein [Seminavis robusta]|uniref:Formamidopyrimidine-DNA glycosylase H2TH DNA-binding domain-containing protein n=1 Tax=Seminavis robusta TaxID=568900 RepID=A0A9N8HTS5_9STRA|nr:expressed unknown protein [Seminavis robusta]|eukprot:Sro1308_g261501.1  (288) ;mRNA; f:27777-28640